MSKELVETRAPDAVPSIFGRRNFIRDIDRLFDRMAAGIEFPAMERLFERAGADGFAPAIDITETKDEYKLVAEMPGLEPSQVDVSVTGDTLVIKGEKKRETEKTEGGVHVSERTFGSFRRSFQLPDDVDANQIEADHRNGVLTVRLPKTGEARQPKKIEVKTAS
ncbi:Hsp20/alpha crystallin family protein [Hansschlegelia sp.]|uniref:Hsp20/alpha crystallin family protein n=1 Tax=Hansschlegelia sp. TaxID=2041892 RepID=UPI002D00CDD0|nr:Hsp20/alpha crystallin family protein [Hansschlegelia sp.]HVI27407.1 Hsp20/alpha crystallin family protein [Hansschlegelia sp.]